MILGIVGKIGSGKSEAINVIKKEHNCIYFSCDNIAKILLDNNMVDFNAGDREKFFIDKEKQKECREKFHPIVFKTINLYLYEFLYIFEKVNNFSNDSEFFRIFCDKTREISRDYSNLYELIRILNKNIQNLNFLKLINIENENISYKFEIFRIFTTEKNNLEFNELINTKCDKLFFENFNNFYKLNNEQKTKDNNIFKNFKNFLDLNNSFVVVESALPSDLLYDMCDKVILIENSYDKKSTLLKNNRTYNEDLIDNILKSQELYEYYYNKADYKVSNDGNLDRFYERVKEVIDEIYFTCKQ